MYIQVVAIIALSSYEEEAVVRLPAAGDSPARRTGWAPPQRPRDPEAAGHFWLAVGSSRLAVLILWLAAQERGIRGTT